MEGCSLWKTRRYSDRGDTVDFQVRSEIEEKRVRALQTMEMEEEALDMSDGSWIRRSPGEMWLPHFQMRQARCWRMMAAESRDG
ncbi:hypothetical protein YC2023_101716 [Brassica napus]